MARCYLVLSLSLSVYICAACGGSSRSAKSSITESLAGRGGESVIVRNPNATPPDAGDAAVDKTGVAPAPDAGSGGASPTIETCSDDGALRCSVVGTGRRERCQSGQWKSTSACAAAEVCTGPGQCQSVTELCRGSAGQAVCDGVVLHVCNQDGTEAAQHSCGSPRQCQAGIAERDCAACSPGDYRCTDVRLERCSDDGKRWDLENTCDTAGLCNVVAHACTKAVCLPSSFTCAGDMLRSCRDDQSGFDDVHMCSPGTCDANAGKCLVCVPGKTSCDGSNALTCSADGSRQDTRPCTSTTPYCAEGSGQCVQCTGTNARECASPAQACREANCNLGSGMCEQQISPEGTDCATLGLTGGRCNLQGTCVECLNDSHCAGKLGRMYCNALSGRCAECASDAQCDTANFKGCSLFGQCVDVAGCGNRVVDVLAGEECDPTAPNWSTDTCDPNRCTRRIYQSCGLLSGRCARDQCSAARVCVRDCSNASDCPRLPGYSVACSTAGQCYLSCSAGLNTSCPLGLFCNTDLDPVQCAGVL
jgi:hypothetical protein